jgi:hypothetical protein
VHGEKKYSSFIYRRGLRGGYMVVAWLPGLQKIYFKRPTKHVD